MRYWIYWNDLVQGPFEVEELRTLRAFTADLPVCEENQQDWTPAAAIPELLPYFQPLVEAYNAAVSAPPPPPPPPQPPMLSPLQGEFFNESSRQQALFDLNGSKQFMFRPVQENPAPAPEATLPPFTSPFRFFSMNLAPMEAPPIPLPKPNVVVPAPQPVIEPDVASEVELGVLEPEETPPVQEPVVQEPVLRVVMSPIPPPPPVIEAPLVADGGVSLTPAIPAARSIPAARPVIRPVTVPDFVPPRRQVSEESDVSETPRLWPWMVGVCLFVMLSISGLYLRLAHSRHTSAKIEEITPTAPTMPVVPAPVTKMETAAPAEKPISVPAPVPAPLPAPVHPSTWQTLTSAGSNGAKTITPAAVMFDAQGQIWVADPVTHHVQAASVSDVAGALQVASWDVKGQAGNAPGQFHAPTGVTTDAQEHIWVADKGNNRVQIYDPATAKWTVLGQAGSARGQFNAPTSVAVDSQGHIWVADKANHRVQTYDPATQQWTSIGQPGAGVGQFKYPAGIAVDPQGMVWVVDQGNHRIQSYNPATAEWTSYGQKGKALGSFNSPTAVAIDPHGRVWVTEQGNDRVQVYNRSTQRWATIGKHGRKQGEFNLPAGVAFDRQGRVWIADRGNHRLQVAQILVAVPLAAGRHVKPHVPAATAAVVPGAAAATPAVEKLLAASGMEPADAVPANANTVPGMSAVKPVPSPTAAPAASPTTPYTAASSTDKWRGHEQDAISTVLKQKIYDGKRTVSENAVMMLADMHEKELLHAGETGERLYLPDKISWSALHEEGPRYRVYLNFQAWQADGSRTLARSDQFSVDLERKTVASLDDSTRHDFYDIASMLMHKTNPKAADIQSVLDGVDAVNRHKLRAVIMKSDKQKDEQKKIQTALQNSQDKLERQVVYFRTKYAEKTLQNIAKAFDFTAMMKGK